MLTQRKYRLFRRNGRWQHNHYGVTDGFCELYLTLAITRKGIIFNQKQPDILSIEAQLIETFMTSEI